MKRNLQIEQPYPALMQEHHALMKAYKAEYELFLLVFTAEVEKGDIGNQFRNYTISARDNGRSKASFRVSESSYLAIIDRMLRARKLSPRYEYYPELESVILVSLGQLEGYGLLMFLNWKEPAKGALPMHRVFPNEGDSVMLAYVEKRQFTAWPGLSPAPMR